MDYQAGAKKLMIGFCLLLLLSCSTENLTEKQPLDFRMAGYQTFSFGSLTDFSTDELRFRSADFEDRVKNELRFQLPARGLEFSQTEPDILVYFFTLPETDEELQLTGIPYSSTPTYDASEVNAEHNFIIDLVDRSQNILIWRGSAKLDLENPEKRNRELPDIINRLLSNLPT